MENTNDQDVDLNNEGGEEVAAINWEERAKSYESELGKMRRLVTKMSKQSPSEGQTETKKSTGFDKSDFAILRMEGIKSEGEMDIVKQVMSESGMDITRVVDSDYLKHRLNAFREEAKAKDAAPDSNNRSENTTRNQVEYWLAKDELPANTPDNRELRQQVVNARIKKNTDSNKFSSMPVVS